MDTSVRLSSPRWTDTSINIEINSDQFRRFLARQGCTFEAGKGGHLIVRREGYMSVLPQHGGSKQLGTGLMRKILKDLRIE